MASYSSLDLLPVELLHTLFSYFLAHEILLSFSDISDYVDAVLLSYSSYRFNFQSIRKNDFDLVCRRIRPDQVISLALSDDNDTPGLSEVFLSRFRMEQFLHLRSLLLVDIEIDSLEIIFPNLQKLTQLRSLSFNIDTIRRQYPIRNNDYSNESAQFKSLLLKTYRQILPQLTHIDLNHSIDLVALTVPHLRHLKLSTFTEDELEIIFQKSLQLKSLDIALYMNTLDSELVLPSNQLIRLKLKIENRRISQDETERFLSNLPHLKYLDLETPAYPDVANGHFWQLLVGSLLTFHFKLNGLAIHVHETLDSFRTPFWLEEKRWFVGYLDGSLFSVPHFTPTHMTSLNLLYFRSTAPDHSFLFQHLDTITMNTVRSNTNEPLTHIKTLILLENIKIIDRLQSSIDLHRVEHLMISSFDQLLTIIPVEDRIPHLKQLTIKESITIEMIEQIGLYRFEQIHALNLEKRITTEQIDFIVEELFRLFPHLKQLRYKSNIESVTMMIRLINGFPYLSNALFYADPSFFRKEEKFCRNPDLIIRHLQQDTHRQTTCRVYHSRNTQRPFSIHWTIEKQEHSSRHRSWRRNYYWYRFKYLLFRLSARHLLRIQYFIQCLIYLPITIFILRPYYNQFDSYFLCFCFISTILLTTLYNVFYRLSTSVRGDNSYFVLTCRVALWFVFCMIVILISLTIQVIYDAIF